MNLWKTQKNKTHIVLICILYLLIKKVYVAQILLIYEQKYSGMFWDEKNGEYVNDLINDPHMCRLCIAVSYISI